MGSAWVSEDPVTHEPLPIFAPTSEVGAPLPQGAFPEEDWPIMEATQKPNWVGGHVVFIVPYIKKHSRYLKRLTKTIEEAWIYSRGPFQSYEMVCFPDLERRGPGWARNRAIESRPDADWYFFVDADDLVKRHCFEAVGRERAPSDTMWGFIEIRDRFTLTHASGKKALDGVQMIITPRNFENLNWGDWLQRGFYGGGAVAIGMFVRGRMVRDIKWLERMYLYEDLEFFAMLKSHGSWKKLPVPLVTIDRLSASCDKPFDRGERFAPNWRTIVSFWKRNGCKKLAPEVFEFRNSCESGEAFYGS